MEAEQQKISALVGSFPHSAKTVHYFGSTLTRSQQLCA
jgi:hypothetical protein